MHLGGDTIFILSHADEIRDAFAEADPANACTDNVIDDDFIASLPELDKASQAVFATLPEEKRQPYSFHNSFSDFARRCGFTVLGTIRPHDFSEPGAHDAAEIIDPLRELRLPAIFGPSFTPSPAMEQVSREANVPIYMIDDNDLPGEPGDFARSYTTMRAQNIEILTEALGGDGSHAVHIEARNIPGAKLRNSAKKGLDDRIDGEPAVDQFCRHDSNAGATDFEKRRQSTGNPIDTAVRVSSRPPCCEYLQ